MSTKETRRFLDVLGDPGRYSWVIFFLVCLNYFPVAFNHLAMSIYGAVPSHRCRVPDGVTADNSSIPETSPGKLDSCHVYANYSYTSDTTVYCPDGWEYTFPYDDSTIVNEWNLVCDDKYLTSLSTTVYFLGVMVGGLGCGPVADLMGRRPLMIITMYVPVLLGVMVYLVESLPLFMLLRFCIGIMMQGVQLTSYVVASELAATSRNRAKVTAFFECAWAAGVMALAGIAYIFRDWRAIQLGITLPTVLTLFWVWWLPESFRWLLYKRRFKESLAYLRRAARFNKVTITPQLEQELRAFCPDNAGTKEEKKYAIWDAFRTPNLRKHSIIMFYIWFATSLGYYGLSLNASSFTGNKYLNFFINGAIEFPAYFAGIWIVGILGRRKPLCFYFLVGGVTCILAGVIPKETGSGHDIAWLSTTLAWIGKFSAAGCWNVIFLYASELFPTAIRNAGVGCCAFWARVGGVIAPQINLAASYSKSWIPFVVFGIVAIIGGILSLVLPETRDLPFPDTFDEAERLGKRSKDAATANGVANEAYFSNDDVKAKSFDHSAPPSYEKSTDFTKL